MKTQIETEMCIYHIYFMKMYVCMHARICIAEIVAKGDNDAAYSGMPRHCSHTPWTDTTLSMAVCTEVTNVRAAK